MPAHNYSCSRWPGASSFRFTARGASRESADKMIHGRSWPAVRALIGVVGAFFHRAGGKSAPVPMFIGIFDAAGK